MTDLNPDLIERCAKALWDEPGWDRASHEQRQHHREAAERALAAVLPGIIQQAKAEAWEQGHRAATLEWAHAYDGHDCAEGEMCRSRIIRRLLGLSPRADRIERGES